MLLRRAGLTASAGLSCQQFGRLFGSVNRNSTAKNANSARNCAVCATVGHIKMVIRTAVCVWSLLGWACLVVVSCFGLLFTLDALNVWRRPGSGVLTKCFFLQMSEKHDRLLRGSTCCCRLLQRRLGCYDDVTGRAPAFCHVTADRNRQTATCKPTAAVEVSSVSRLNRVNLLQTLFCAILLFLCLLLEVLRVSIAADASFLIHKSYRLQAVFFRLYTEFVFCSEFEFKNFPGCRETARHSVFVYSCKQRVLCSPQP